MIFRVLLFAALAYGFAAAPARAADTFTSARYSRPVERYGHFALGRPHEYARLEAVTSAGRTLLFDLPEDEVFEDLAPRLVKLGANESPELLTIVSQRRSGARLVLLRVEEQSLVISAQSAPIGTPMRWLNPVGVADLDGDGDAEIVAVITPHIGGILKLYQKRGSALVEIAALPGFSNHAYGSPELRQSVVDGKRLVVPDATRRRLRIITMQRGTLIETGNCALAAPVTGEIKLVSPGVVSVGLATGPVRITVDVCR